MNDRHSIDELFKNGLEDHSEAPSDQVWQKVRAQVPHRKKRAYGPILRAAVIVLFFGLGSVMYFNRNEQQLMDFQPVVENNGGITKEPNKPSTNGQNKTSLSNPETNQTKETPSKPVKQKAQNGVPVLQTPSKKAYRMVEYRVPEVDESVLRNEEALWEASSMAMAELELQESSVETAKPYKMIINLPPVESYYGPDTVEQENPAFKERFWAYATDQFNRLLAGEKPQLPLPKKRPTGVIVNVPRSLN